jgi:hypothetical protein
MKKIYLAVLLVFVLLPLTACERELPPVDDVIDSMVEAMGQVESFRHDAEIKMQLYFMAEDMPVFFPLDIDMDLNAVGAHDLVNHEMETVMNLVVTGADNDSLKMDVSFYIIEDEMYVMFDYPVLSPMWMKSEIPGTYMQEIDDLGVFIELFQLLDMEITGTERKEGVNCYVLEARPDISRMFASFLLPADEYNTGYSEADWEIIEEIFRDFSMKLWIAHDTYRVVSADINIQMEVSPEMMDIYDEEGRFSLDIAITTHFHHYDQSMDIDLPPEAEDAEEASFW